MHSRGVNRATLSVKAQGGILPLLVQVSRSCQQPIAFPGLLTHLSEVCLCHLMTFSLCGPWKPSFNLLVIELGLSQSNMTSSQLDCISRSHSQILNITSS